MVDQRLPREHRLRSAREFQQVYRQRCTASEGPLLVFGRRSGLPHARLGISVSRKIGGAVVRNRWKRRIREAFRQIRGQLPSGIDLVVVVRQADEIELAQIKSSLPRLAQRVAGRLAKERP